MKHTPSSKPKAIIQVGLVVLLITAAATFLGALANPPVAPRANAVIPLPTPTVSDLQRNAAKDAQALLASQQAVTAHQTPAPALADVARKQPRQPLAAAAEIAVFQPIPNGITAGSGAIVQVRPPFSNNQYHIENAWYTDSAGASKRTFVFAGNVAGPGGEVTDQGVVILQTLQYVTVDGAPQVKTLETHAYTTTLTAGSLHITGAESSRLILQANANAITYFDLATLSFILP